MNPKSDEKNYKELFQQLRKKDESHAPSFEQVWQTALSKKTGTERTWSFHRFTIAAALMIALAGSLLFYKNQHPTPITTIGEWQAPTNSLLNFPGHGMLLAEISMTKPKIAVSLSEWESPTTFLLEIPGFDIKKTIFEN